VKGRRVKRVAETRKASPPLNVVVDVNVLLDVMLDRTPWAHDATRLLDACAEGAIRGYIAGSTVTTVHYLVERARGRERAATVVSDLLTVLDVVPLHGADFQRALGLGFPDYEDAVQVAAALQIGADVVVTRNERDFKGSPVPVLTAGEALALASSGR
jgi:predicted nucleic acid-binding protein